MRKLNGIFTSCDRNIATQQMEKTARKYISVIGAGICDPATTAIAEEVGRLIARAGAILICGGLGGVMEAACKGAKEAGGTTIGILPVTALSAGKDGGVPEGIFTADNAAVAVALAGSRP